MPGLRRRVDGAVQRREVEEADELRGMRRLLGHREGRVGVSGVPHGLERETGRPEMRVWTGTSAQAKLEAKWARYDAVVLDGVFRLPVRGMPQTWRSMDGVLLAWDTRRGR